MLHVHWLIPMLLYILVAFIGIRWMGKKIVGLHSRTKRLFLQYLFSAIFAVTFAAIMGHLRFNMMTVTILVVGFLNGFACYANWKAVDVSLSKSALFTFGDDLIAMGLFTVFVPQAARAINLPTGIGIVLCVATAVLFAFHAYKKKEPLAFFGYTLFFSVLWGIAQFYEAYAATSQLPVGQFLSSWYVGAFIASCIIMLFYKDPDKSQQGNEQLTRRDVGYMFIYAFGIALCLAIAYWVYSLAPQVIAQPVFLVGEAVVPMIVGWIVFNERKTFDKAQWAFSALGITGVLSIAFGF